jgi:AraC-like DNA-binding protein
LRISAESIPHAEQMLHGAMAIALNVLRSLCGAELQPSGVRFACRRPADPKPLRDFFRAPLTFEASETVVVFPSSWLDRPVRTADPVLRAAMERRARAIGYRDEEDLLEELRRVLPALLATGSNSVALAAHRLDMAVRTLNRRLAARGTSFRQLRDETRHAVACQLLAHTDLPVREIARRIGYAHASAFTPAFRRWTGEGPAEWRRTRAARA